MCIIWSVPRSWRHAPRMQLIPRVNTRKEHGGLDQLRGRGFNEQWWVSQFETVACSDHHAMPMMTAHATLIYLVLRPEVKETQKWFTRHEDSFCLIADPIPELWEHTVNMLRFLISCVICNILYVFLKILVRDWLDWLRYYRLHELCLCIHSSETDVLLQV